MIAEIKIRGYLTFRKWPQAKARKTEVYHVYNTSNYVCLGQIRWKSQWRRYAFFPCMETVFDSNCLDTIIKFIRELMEARRHKSNDR